jgi:hypothetical protein
MINKLATHRYGVAILAAFTINAHAQFDPSVIDQKLHHWQFNETNGAPLTVAADSVATSAWIYDLGYNPTTSVQSSTIQSGAFEIKRPGTGFYINSFAPVSSVTTETIFLVADVTWDYTGSSSGADARFGFHNATAGENTTSPTAGSPPVTILTEMVLRRNTATEIQLGGWGSQEDGTTHIMPTTTAPWVTVGGAVQSTPVRLVLQLNLTHRWGAIHWSTDGGVSFGTVGGVGHTFALNATWNANFVRLAALNNFVSGTGTGLQLHDLYVAIPEPPLPLVSVTATVPTANRQGPVHGVFALTRSGDTSGSLTATYNVSGTATPGVDYVALPGSVTFQPGAASTNIVVQVLDPGAAQATESVILSVTAGTGHGVGSPSSATISILDDKSPEVSIVATQPILLEGFAGATASFRVERKGLTSPALTVNLSYGGTAANGTDFMGPASVGLNAEATSATFSITPIRNPAYTGDKTAIAQLASGSGYDVGAPVSATATIIDAEFPAGTILFEDDFLNPTESATKWVVHTSDNFQDTYVDWAYDYSGDGIPSAPHSQGGATIGAKLRVTEWTGAVNALSLFPDMDFTGDYRVSFDSWQNYIGSLNGGGGGSTHHATAGIGSSGNQVQWWHGLSDGVWFMWDGDGANGAPTTGDRAGLRDYNAMVEAQFQAESSGVYAAGTGSNSRSSGNAYYSLWGGVQAPALQQSTHPSQSGTTLVGSMGFAWHRVVITKQGNTITWTIDGMPIATVDASSVSLGSKVFVGYSDLWPGGVANNAVQFALVDNFRVETLATPPVLPEITQIQIINGGTQVQIDFTGGASDSPSSFTLTSSSTVNGTYADVASTITQISPGQFRSVRAVSGPVQFYRIKRL